MGFEAENVIMQSNLTVLFLVHIGGTIKITDSVFNSTSSVTVLCKKYQDSLYLTEGTALFSNVSILNQSETYGISAFYSNAGQKTTIENSIIHENIEIYLDTITFDNVKVTKAPGILIETQGAIKFKNSHFENITSIYLSGGSTYQTHYINLIQNTNFSDCKFNEFSLANWSISDSSFINSPGFTFREVKNYFISNSVFKNNNMATQGKNGGSLYFDNANGTITSSHFESSTAVVGGAIVANHSLITLNSCSFSECSASDYGGAVYVSGEYVMTSCTFDSCTAQYGGAIVGCSYFSTSEISSCTFDNNIATSDKGSAFSCAGCDKITAYTNFTGNEFNGHHHNDVASYADDDDTIYCNFVNHIGQVESDDSLPIWVYVVVSLVCILVLAILCIISMIVIVHKKRQRETFQIQVEEDFGY